MRFTSNMNAHIVASSINPVDILNINQMSFAAILIGSFLFPL